MDCLKEGKSIYSLLCLALHTEANVVVFVIEDTEGFCYLRGINKDSNVVKDSSVGYTPLRVSNLDPDLYKDIPIAKTIKTSVGARVRHFKGKEYTILCFAKEESTDMDYVVYKANYKDDNGIYQTYARPFGMFMSEVDRCKYPNAPQKYRFEVIA